ncbi:MAG: hypothetical protein ACC707_16775, partial [Thiohalomonadales bacterium]
QDILENLGWTVRRIWSTDWFKNPEAQIQPIVRELDTLKTHMQEVTQGIEPEEILEPAISIDLECNDIPLRDRLIAFDREVINAQRSDVDEDARLLRPAMLEALLNFLPCSKAEFLEKIPAYLREGTSSQEAMYLEGVVDLIADYG